MNLTPEQRGELLVLVTREMGVLQDTLSWYRGQQRDGVAPEHVTRTEAAFEQRLALLTTLRQALAADLEPGPD